MVGSTPNEFTFDISEEVTKVTATWSSSTLKCEFTRLLDTKDSNDKVIVAGEALDIAFGTGSVGGTITEWNVASAIGTHNIMIGTTADIPVSAVIPPVTTPKENETESTTKTESLGNLQLVVKMSLAVFSGALINGF